MTIKKQATRKAVVKKKTTATKAVKKPTPPKAIKPKTIKTQKQITVLVKQTNETKLAEWKKTETVIDQVRQDWVRRLVSTKNRMRKLHKIVEKITIKLLEEAYSVYSEVIKTDLADDFFDALKHELRKEGIKVQRNTPHASLVIRYIYAKRVSAKVISEHAKVLESADYNNIKPEQFIAWVQHKTMTRVIEDQRNINNNVETRAEKMARARAVIMRLIEARETKPVHSWTTTAQHAEKQISEQSLWVGIGNAHRILNGGSNFNASMNLVMMLPLNIEMERHILNIYAKTIVDGIDYYEKQMNSLEEKVWADELWEKLVNAGYEESVKQDEYWSNRQQAAMFENQQEFAKFVKEKKKEKKQSKKKT